MTSFVLELLSPLELALCGRSGGGCWAGAELLSEREIEWLPPARLAELAALFFLSARSAPSSVGRT